MSYNYQNPFNYQDTISVTLSDNTMNTSSNSIYKTTISTASPTPQQLYNYSHDYSNWTITTGTGTDTISLGDYTTNLNPSTLDVKGDANFEGDVKIKGKSLVESLEKIEEKLAILRPNEKLEERWDELRELRKQYMALEKEIIEKEKVWDILKK